MKILFYFIVNRNNCLNSNFLIEYEFSARIPLILIYLFGVIKLDSSDLEEVFWEGLQTSVPIKTFKHISIKEGKILIVLLNSNF